METALERTPKEATEATLRAEFGPIWRSFFRRFYEGVRFPAEAESRLTELHRDGFVVHVMRSTAWVNFLYLTWAMVRRGLPPVRAVVNLRPWLTRPWTKTAQRGEFDVRFTYARRMGGSGLIFLKKTSLGSAHGRNIKEDPFPALVAMARRSDCPVYLVPELFVWEKWKARLTPSLVDRVFGSPEAPGFLHSILAFFRNYHRAQFRVGDPVDLRSFIQAHPTESDEVIARKVRGAIHHHLARETRAVFGPPAKSTDRLIEEVLRDRQLRHSLEEAAVELRRSPTSVLREARRALRGIAARMRPTVVGLTEVVLRWVFNRLYDGIEVDEAGFDRALKVASQAPLVLVPSHKSHIDYLVLSYVLWTRGYTVPLVAAGANLSFFPLGPYLRRLGAFFLRRSFHGDRVYTAVFRAYLKKLVHDGYIQEFFPEGTRSRTGKLLNPRLGLLAWEIDAVLEGARDDLLFAPVAIDYEKVVEGTSYSRELAGGQKKAEDVKALLTAPKVLTKRYGRIHLSFDQPISLAEFMRARGLDPRRPLSDEQKRHLVRALGHRIMWGIVKVSTLTPHALAAAALLAHRQRGLAAKEAADRVALLRRVAEEDGVPLSPLLANAPNDPTVLGPIRDAIDVFISDELVLCHEARGETIYQCVDERRSELAFSRNTLMNMVANRSLVAAALLSTPAPASFIEVRERALFLSRLFKLEFIYRVGTSFEAIFSETVEKLEAAGLLARDGDVLALAADGGARPLFEFLGDLVRDYLESYRVAVTAAGEALAQRVERRELVKLALEIGRAEFLAGKLGTAESVSRANYENAFAWLMERGYLREENKRVVAGPLEADAPAALRALAERIGSFLAR